MSNQAEQRQSPSLTSGQFYHPGTQNSLLWISRDVFLQAVADCTPEIFDTLRDNVLPLYREQEARVAHYYARKHAPDRLLDWEQFARSVPSFLFESAVGLVDRHDRIEFDYLEIREYVTGYPGHEPSEVFFDTGLALENTLQTTLQAFEPEARQQEYELYLAGLFHHVTWSQIEAFAREALPRVLASSEALRGWAREHNLDINWVLRNARETLFQGAFAPTPGRFPTGNKWELSVDEWAVSELVERDFPRAGDIRVPFDYRPLVETRDAFEEHSLAAFKAARKRAVAHLESHLAKAGYVEGTQSKLQQHHFEWLAFAQVRRATADHVLNAWSALREEPAPENSTVTRGIRSAAEFLDIDPPLVKGRREKKQD